MKNCALNDKSMKFSTEVLRYPYEDFLDIGTSLI